MTSSLWPILPISAPDQKQVATGIWLSSDLYERVCTYMRIHTHAHTHTREGELVGGTEEERERDELNTQLAGIFEKHSELRLA